MLRLVLLLLVPLKVIEASSNGNQNDPRWPSSHVPLRDTQPPFPRMAVDRAIFNSSQARGIRDECSTPGNAAERIEVAEREAAGERWNHQLCREDLADARRHAQECQHELAAADNWYEIQLQSAQIQLESSMEKAKVVAQAEADKNCQTQLKETAQKFERKIEDLHSLIESTRELHQGEVQRLHRQAEEAFSARLEERQATSKSLQALQKFIREIADEHKPECIICEDALANRMPFMCQHVLMCEDCAPKCVENFGKCPFEDSEELRSVDRDAWRVIYP